MKNVFIILLLIPFCGYSQYKISGKLVNENNSPVEYAEVTLQTSNSISLHSELTNKYGEFNINNIKGDNYELSIKYFSQNVYSQFIIIDNNLDLKTINLNIGISLTGVILENKKSLIENKVDRMVFNVENSVAATGGNALDALKLTPRIKVQNDEISMIGKGSMLIMINDKLVQFSGEELATYLKTLNASDLKKIEVLSNPPSKYSAEGNSGIINIVTKKTKKDAWDASLRTIYQQSTYAKTNNGGSFNIQKGRVQVNSGLNYINGSNAPEYTNQIYYPSLTWEKVNNRRDFSNLLSTKLGMEYKINDKLSTGFNYNFVSNKPLRKEIGKTNLFDSQTKALDSIIKTISRGNYEKTTSTLNYHIAYDIDSIGRKLSIDFDYFNYKNIANRFLKTQTFLPSNEPIENNLLDARNYGFQDIQNYAVNIDMVHPGKWAEFNYGGRISFTNTNNYFNYFNIKSNIEEIDPGLSNEFIYKENTQAVYCSAEKNLSEQWKTKIGIRHEFTQTEGLSRTVIQSNSKSYARLFPTFFLSFTPNENHSFSANYGKRIKRPGYSLLNPFKYVSNLYSYSEGNPFLQPSFTNNIELEYAHKSNLITKIYFSHTNNNFDQVTILDEITNIEKIIPLNYITNKMLGINQTFIFKLSKWWNINTSVDVYYSSTNSTIPVTLQYLKGWNGEFNISNDLTLNNNKTVLFNTNMWFITKGVNNLDYNSNGIQVDTSFKWLLLNKKLIISLNLEDIINPKGIKYTSYSNGIKNSFRNYNDDQCFKLGIIYNFGKKINVNKREYKNQEEQNRID
ncbi:outer membrane beta-barrel family protein [[Flexibacter] sp. ATCC 35103]|uniref:outer membrane beta-barrel family protein n=1 Tax=[Flexibacter] sp. ATCC 35103 TaxID=1937528 RepID=UPI0009C4BE07|nr:outer membrane beta-barrel family protein [[Flexibacter] sp. ATCC 35103]OMQ08709.1 hypothetical protein BXU01_20155 [[Flexibacter] sp. ATCC 35103]